MTGSAGAGGGSFFPTGSILASGANSGGDGRAVVVYSLLLPPVINVPATLNSKSLAVTGAMSIYGQGSANTPTIAADGVTGIVKSSINMFSPLGGSAATMCTVTVPAFSTSISAGITGGIACGQITLTTSAAITATTPITITVTFPSTTILPTVIPCITLTPASIGAASLSTSTFVVPTLPSTTKWTGMSIVTSLPSGTAASAFTWNYMVSLYSSN
jgi:hypothetical protein